ncbi:MAG TPA: Gfo/Idh/MocA family oxidoreductase [Verrucomicrobiae bacterium]|jgi:predicted dehydrogenase|nr:Gfo/Idh/MocA family oxidoreductase [Verrucomicrobiae bacterium]
MSENEANQGQNDFNRRDFIKSTASLGSLMLLMGGTPLYADDATPKQAETDFSTEDQPINFAVIGCGTRGKEILQTLALLPGGTRKDGTPNPPNAPVVAICDNYKPAIKRVKDYAPNAQVYDDYKKLLEQKDVECVVVATPSHLHRDIVIAALQAGKHVYCEAPLATTVEDARAIAKAAKAAEKLNFQSGLQMRSDPGKKFVLDFVHTGAVGTPVMARSQWHKRESWRKAGSTSERDKEVNWRLYSETSAGLAGEIGVHQYDLVTWMLGKKPLAVTGFGSILDPKIQDSGDDRDVADTIQTIMEYPRKVNAMYDCTLANSFDGEYDMIYGTGAAILFRPESLGQNYTPAKAWLFEEVDSQVFGWEVYAAKEQFHKEVGITLSAGASHSTSGKKGIEASPYQESTLHYALKAFAHNSLFTATHAKAFTDAYGADAEGFLDEMAKPENAKGRLPAAGYREGFDATVIAIKANEAIKKREKVMLPKELFDI